MVTRQILCEVADNTLHPAAIDIYTFKSCLHNRYYGNVAPKPIGAPENIQAAFDGLFGPQYRKGVSVDTFNKLKELIYDEYPYVMIDCEENYKVVIPRCINCSSMLKRMPYYNQLNKLAEECAVVLTDDISVEDSNLSVIDISSKGDNYTSVDKYRFVYGVKRSSGPDWYVGYVLSNTELRTGKGELFYEAEFNPDITEVSSFMDMAEFAMRVEISKEDHI